MALLFCVVLALGGWTFVQLGVPVTHGSSHYQLVVVSPGMNVTEAGDVLASRHLIRSAFFWKVLIHLQAQSPEIKAGTYRFTPSMTPQSMLTSMSAGKVAQHPLLVPEGFDVQQIADRLQGEHIVTAATFLAAARDWHNPYLHKGAAVRYAAEGYLFPATYAIPFGASAQVIVAQMTRVFTVRFTPAMRRQAASEHLTVNQAMTIASLVEKEAKLSPERPLIAAVFLNRLHLGMPMQSDPTVAYALRKALTLVTLADEMVPSPYNTYYRRGLPPGPICSPGLPSIEAVLHPAHVGYLYFVGKPDGSHIFSYTYAQQLAAEQAVARLSN